MKFNLLSIFFLALLAACAVTPPAPQHLSLTPVSFDDLAGWQNDTPSAALAAFRHSCGELMHRPSNNAMGIAGKIGDWQQACAVAQNVGDSDDAARAYFENTFRPYAAAGTDGDSGLFTGYYVPELRGALTQGGAFQTPLYARPNDMIGVDLGAFKSELKGQHIVGKVTGTKLIPYDDRAAIAKGSLSGRAEPLAWVDDPAAAFFLEVQGSGRIRLPDNSVLPLGYDGANGHAYIAIGKAMADRGEIARPVTMPAIRAWLAAHPDQAQDILNLNPSYIFFRPPAR